MTLNEAYLFPYIEYSELAAAWPPDAGPLPAFNVALPVKHWFDPAFVGSTSFESVEYIVINSKDQTIDPYLEEIYLPKFMAGLPNIPSQEWEVSEGKLGEIPIPVTEEFYKMWESGEIVLKWNAGAIQIIPGVSDSTPVEFTHGDHARLERIESMLIGMNEGNEEEESS